MKLPCRRWMVFSLLLAGCLDPVTPVPQPSAPPPAAQSSTSPPNQSPPATERVAATVDTVGTKGKDYGGGPISEPLRQRWRQADRLLLLQVEKAVTDYASIFNEGKYPASHEEFMEKVVQEFKLQLPSLPPGERYVYDPETRKLMIERPVANP